MPAFASQPTFFTLKIQRGTWAKRPPCSLKASHQAPQGCSHLPISPPPRKGRKREAQKSSGLCFVECFASNFTRPLTFFVLKFQRGRVQSGGSFYGGTSCQPSQLPLTFARSPRHAKERKKGTKSGGLFFVVCFASNYAKATHFFVPKFHRDVGKAVAFVSLSASRQTPQKPLTFASALHWLKIGTDLLFFLKKKQKTLALKSKKHHSHPHGRRGGKDIRGYPRG